MSVLLLLALAVGDAVPEVSVAADELGKAVACDNVSPAAEDVGFGVKDAIEDDCAVVDELCDKEDEEGIGEGLVAGVGLLLRLEVLEGGFVDAIDEVGRLVNTGVVEMPVTPGNSTNVWVAVTVVGGVVAELGADVELARVEPGVIDQIQLTTSPLIVAVTHCVCASATLLYDSRRRPAAFFMVEKAAKD